MEDFIKIFLYGLLLTVLSSVIILFFAVAFISFGAMLTATGWMGVLDFIVCGSCLSIGILGTFLLGVVALVYVEDKPKVKED